MTHYEYMHVLFGSSLYSGIEMRRPGGKPEKIGGGGKFSPVFFF